ncbi:hypothetical protein HED60_08775 [Planctomycetales bacterium ZRK34]|nr:hypothetical protein HED60_08775 [Planctomycetales bacterium ZRK34]
MPTSGKQWHHIIIINTRGSWLTGDPRGFHSRNHRKHSDGDYKAPPPPGQHLGLYRVIKSNSRDAIALPRDLWATIGRTMLDKLTSQDHRALAICVDAHHVHLLVELPSDRRRVKRLVGTWKQRASHAVRDRLPGEIWSKSCDPIPVRDVQHHRRVYRYILNHAKRGAWTWSFRAE